MAEVVTYSRLQHVSVLTEFIETQIYSVHLLFGNKYIHTHTHTQPFYGPLGFCVGLPAWAGTRKV